MDCCDPDLYDDQFDEAEAEARLREYRRGGPRGGTARLIAGLFDDGVEGLTVLDIGAGVGAVHLELLAAGAASATDVDASGAYLAAARSEAERRGLADRVTYLKGDAVGLTAQLPPADLVALDRVVCCYPDMERLVGVAADRTRKRLGMVLPRDSGWIRAGVGLSNRWSSLRGDAFRFHVHRTAAIMSVARAAGLRLSSTHKGLFWQTLVLERATA